MMRNRKRTTRTGRLGMESLEARLFLAADSLLITEIMYNPALTTEEDSAGLRERDLEFIELTNTDSSPLQLAGVEFTQGIEFTFPAMTLGSHERIVVVNNATAFVARYGSEVRVAGEYSGTLANGGEQLTLTVNGTEIMTFEFDQNWFTSTDGNGYSLTVADPSLDRARIGEPSSWVRSSATGGTPGEPDPAQGFVAREVDAELRSQRKVLIDWEPATAAEQLREYRVYRNGTLLGTTNQTSYEDISVVSGTEYTYEIAVVDQAGTEYVTTYPQDVRVPVLGGDPLYEPAGQVPVAGVAEHELIELSGLAASRRNSGVLWLHDDGSGHNAVHAISTAGNYLGSLTLQGAPSIDWEDIAVGPGPQAGTHYIYAGDIGDNNADRAGIVVYRVAEPEISSAPGPEQNSSTRNFHAINLQYPNGEAYDAEALFVDPVEGDLYVLTKENNASQVFRAPAESLSGTAPITMTLVTEINFDVASAADISQSGDKIVIRNEDEAVMYVRGAGVSIADALNAPGFTVPVVGTPDEPNGEAIAFAADDSGYITISEGAQEPFYIFQRLLPARPGDANGDGSIDGSDFNLWLAHRNSGDALWSEGDFNGDGTANGADFTIWNQNRFSSSASITPAPSTRTPRAALRGAGAVPGIPSEDVSSETSRAAQASTDRVFGDDFAFQELGARRAVDALPLKAFTYNQKPFQWRPTNTRITTVDMAIELLSAQDLRPS